MMIVSRIEVDDGVVWTWVDGYRPLGLYMLVPVVDLYIIIPGARD